MLNQDNEEKFEMKEKKNSVKWNQEKLKVYELRERYKKIRFKISVICDPSKQQYYNLIVGFQSMFSLCFSLVVFFKENFDFKLL